MKQFCFSKMNRTSVTLFLLLPGLFSPTAFARSSQEKLTQARIYYDDAEKARVVLQETPAQERTIKDYLNVIHAFRLVYETAPMSSKNAKSLIAIGELYQTMAFNFDKKNYYRSAVRAYDFLLHEYPYSQYQAEALLTSAQICQSDLKQPEEARQRFQQFLQKYPRSPEAERARLAIERIDSETAGAKESPQPLAALRKKPEPEPAAPVSDVKQTGDPKQTGETKPPEDRLPQTGARVAVTDVREWVTPTSTRVVIHVAGEVKYEIGRVDNPPRIYLDLYGTKLNREVSRAVRQKMLPADGGLVKSLRAAQYKVDVTRVVAELDGRADYSVFDLPNPYRVILEFGNPKNREQGTGNREQKGPNPVAEKSEVASGKKDMAGPVRSLADKVTADVPLPPSAGTPAKRDSVPVTPASEEKPAPAAGGPGIRPAPIKRDGSAALQPAVRKTAAAPSADKVQTAQLQTGDSPSHPYPSENSKTASTVAAPAEDRSRAIPPSLDGAGSQAARSDRAGADKVTSTPVPEPVPPAPASRGLGAPAAKNDRGSTSAGPENARPAQPNRDGTRSLTRALGLKIGRIILDPGHGGHDTGTIGPGGLYEKDLVLDVALRLGKLISERLGSEVIYTRQDDTFIPLESRTAIANEQQADLFLSIHANSSSSQRARGIETYYLSFATDPQALEVAARENAVSQESIHELQDLVKKIALHEKVDESKEFAIDVQSAMHDRLSKDGQQRKNRGVKKAPFMVLVGAKMPSVLAEIAFLSNPQEEKLLKTKQQRQKIAEALYNGIAKYVDTLSGVKVAGGVTLAPPTEK